MAAGSLPAVRRGDHLLGARRAGQVTRRDLRIGFARRGGLEARRGSSGASRSATGSRRGSCRCSGSTPANPNRAKSRSPPGSASSSRSPRTGPPSSSSKTCTGPTPRCSSSCRTSPSGRTACRCCSCAPPGRSCSRGTAPGAPGRATRTRSICRRSPTARPASSCTGCSSGACPSRCETTILERAGGNPLYAEEFVRLVADRGLGDTGEGIAFPDSVHSLIAARLDTLSPERKGLLQDAAVVGKVFWSSALAEMGDLDEREVELALHELSRRELVRPARTSTMEGESEYAFWHVLLRDVAYGQIPRAARARKHRAAASWMEAKAGERVGDLADVLAYHYQEALELARAAGDETGRGRARPGRATDVRARGRSGRVARPSEGGRASTTGRPRSMTPTMPAQAPLLLKAARTVAGLSVPQAEEDAGRAAALFAGVGDELGAAEALRRAQPLRLLPRVALRRSANAPSRRCSCSSAIRPVACSRIYLAQMAGGEMMGGRAAECIVTLRCGDRNGQRVRPRRARGEDIAVSGRCTDGARRSRRARRPPRVDRAPQGCVGPLGRDRPLEPRRRHLDVGRGRARPRAPPRDAGVLRLARAARLALVVEVGVDVDALRSRPLGRIARDRRRGGRLARTRSADCRRSRSVSPTRRSSSPGAATRPKRRRSSRTFCRRRGHPPICSCSCPHSRAGALVGVRKRRRRPCTAPRARTGRRHARLLRSSPRAVPARAHPDVRVGRRTRARSRAGRRSDGRARPRRERPRGRGRRARRGRGAHLRRAAALRGSGATLARLRLAFRVWRTRSSVMGGASSPWTARRIRSWRRLTSSTRGWATSRARPSRRGCSRRPIERTEIVSRASPPSDLESKRTE